MPISKSLAMQATTFEHKTLKDSKGNPIKARRSGRTRIWKRQPERYSIPCKHGLYDHLHITETDDNWIVSES